MAIALRRLTNTRKCNVTTTCCAARSESKWFLAVTGAILPNTKSKIKQSLLFQNDTEIFTTIAQWINISKIFSGISCFAIQCHRKRATKETFLNLCENNQIILKRNKICCVTENGDNRFSVCPKRKW